MTKKKENSRKSKKYPYLDKKYNLKSRQDYMDNLHYVDGIKNKNKEEVIRPLNEEEKEFLNKFNGEYYGASFDPDDSKNLHQYKADADMLQSIRDSIKDLKSKIKVGEKTNMDREKLRVLHKEVVATRQQLTELNPKLKCYDANNQRNSCLLNKGKSMNTVKFIPWNSMDQDLIGTLDIELLYILNEIEKETK